MRAPPCEKMSEAPLLAPRRAYNAWPSRYKFSPWGGSHRHGWRKRKDVAYSDLQKKPMQRDPPKAISMVQYIVAEGNRKVTTQFHETGNITGGTRNATTSHEIRRQSRHLASPGLVKITKISGVAFGEYKCVHKWWRQAAARRLGRRKRWKISLQLNM